MRKQDRIMLVRRLIDTNQDTEIQPPLTLQEKATLLLLEIAEMKGIRYTIEGFDQVLSVLNLDKFTEQKLDDLKELYAKEERQLLYKHLFETKSMSIPVLKR